MEEAEREVKVKVESIVYRKEALSEEKKIEEKEGKEIEWGERKEGRKEGSRPRTKKKMERDTEKSRMGKEEQDNERGNIGHQRRLRYRLVSISMYKEMIYVAFCRGIRIPDVLSTLY